jgi:hypothetical protein
MKMFHDTYQHMLFWRWTFSKYNSQMHFLKVYACIYLTNIPYKEKVIIQGVFIMSFIITNIYNKKTTPTLTEMFTATTRDVLCVHHRWHNTHRYEIKVLATRVSTWAYSEVTSPHWPKGMDHCSSEEYWCANVKACVARTWISYRCVLYHPWCTHWTYLVVKKNFFSVFLWLWTIPLR